MKWQISNALSRDVERQHLNAILRDIASKITTPVAAGSTPIPVTNTTKYAVAKFMLKLAGAVTGSAQVDGLGDVTIDTVINPASGFIKEAPIDNQHYWRWNGEWDPISDVLVYLKTTDDLPEGILNLYFTNERAQDAVAAALTNSPSIMWTYNDPANTITATVIGIDSISRVSNEAVDLTRGTAVCMVGGMLRRARAISGFKDCVGLLDEDVLVIGNTGKVQTDGVFTTTTLMWDAATGMVGGLVPQTTYYLSDAGKITPYASTTSGNYVAPVGYALSSTSMRIELNPTILL